MRRKKVIVSDGKIIHDGNAVRIIKEINGEVFYEIGNEITSDVAESVSIMMRNNKIKQSTWDVEIHPNTNNISSDKCLYWLSGGDKEWVNKKNYTVSWSDVYLEYRKEYEDVIMDIIYNSKTLRDIRDGFIKHINLLTLYEFALSKNYIK